MNVAVGPPHGELVAATGSNRARLSRQAKTGRATRLAAGLYAVGAILPAEQVARHHLNTIVSMYWPAAVFCGRTALAGGMPVSGAVYVAHPDPPRRSPLELPGISIVPVDGPGRLVGDMTMPDGLAMAGPARVLVENVTRRGRPARHQAGTAAVDDRIDELARSGGAGRIRTTLGQLDAIAPFFDRDAVSTVRSRLAAVLGSLPESGLPASGRLAARLAGTPFDSLRVTMIEELVDVLRQRSPTPVPANPPARRWEWLAFFESYFSNFIDGTEFGVDEARRIAVDGVVPTARPQDAHDIVATYQLASDPVEAARVPRSGEELVAMLKARHGVLMAARDDKRPGEFKEVANFAGGYQFVEPPLVDGTLIEGFAAIEPLHSPIARATAMMALVTECHPFDDGNGRVARLAANAELSVAGEVRLMIPNVYRNNYLAALNGFSNRAGRGESLVAVLEFAQRWAAAVDWTTYEGAHAALLAANAYTDAGLADSTGVRLTMPP